MLANTTGTPRPRPPAQIRRSSGVLKSSVSTPPPSYASAFSFPPRDGRQPRLDTLLGSPMSATFQMVGWDHANAAADPAQLSPARDDADPWMNEKSREELSELLVKADDLIKERESELNVTSAVCKSLYENNVALKGKHQALLARLPSSSPSASPKPSPTPLSHTPRHESQSSDIGYGFPPHPSSFRGHARKISVSPSDISLLADQNAELLDKLERLESESSSADLSGRRELKRLEKEISVLRNELEKTQLKSEELEEKTKVGFGWGSEKVIQEVWRKKKEREAKFRAMRQSFGPSEEDEEAEIRNFAPEGSLFGGPSSTFSFFPTDESPGPRRPSFGSSSARGPSTQAPRESEPPEQSEHAVISQLLLKIQELEDTNSRIIEQQVETTNQLQAVQRETEHISKVYESLADQQDVELELVGEEMTGMRTAEEDTIRFRSLKRTIGRQPSRATLGSLRGVDPGNGGSGRLLGFSTVPKSRKSVVGLFDGPDTTPGESRVPPRLFSLPVPFTSSSHNEGHRASLSVSTNGLASPALSTLSLSNSPQSQLLSELSPLAGSHPTLENELGREFNDNWGLQAGNHHLRTSSLYDLTQLSAPTSPSPMSVSRSRSTHSREREEGFPTPMSMTHNVLRLSVEPPTPEKKEEEDGGGSPGPRGRSVRYQRMSQTVRSRTSRWVDGRFGDSLRGVMMPDDENEDGNAGGSSVQLPRRLASALDAVVDSFTEQLAADVRSSRSSRSSRSLSRSPREAKARELHRDNKYAVGDAPRGKRERAGTFVLELWLWLQFCVIILLFLWAMAKRGPKAVLGEAEQRRSVSASSRR